MQSALIIHSRHTRVYAEKIAREYGNVEFLEVTRPPTEEVLKIKTDKDVVIGIGGGSVIDTAKIISKDKRCIAIPTTASGAAVTPYATVWGREKTSVSTEIPVLRIERDIPLDLPEKVIQSTAFDALAHSVESFWSAAATKESREYCKKAIGLIMKYFRNREKTYLLIEAGNLAGQAIAISKTNVIHASSYPLTTEYGIDHGTACGMLLPFFIEYMDYDGLLPLFGANSTEELVGKLRKLSDFAKIDGFNAEMIAGKILKYDKINQGPKKIGKEQLVAILKKAAGA
ncbi:MAG: iron-containing alcohol dehydrogenase [Elusimicrobia bacterium]|nr:iron-containing alcohol dehydrogenase [Elusimicrobiota bacterium]